MNKEEYLKIRANIIIGQFNENVMDFLSNWCQQESRRFDLLMFILEKGNQHGFISDLLQRLIIFLDRKFAVNKVWSVDSGEIIRIY